MFKERATQKEWLDSISYPQSMLFKNLKEFEKINQWLGAKRALLEGLELVYKRNLYLFKQKTISIADLGCGGGDLLSAIEKWAYHKNIQYTLIGLDINSEILQYARNFTAKNAYQPSKIQYHLCDLLGAKEDDLNFDIICLNNICHHMSDQAIIDLLKKLMMHPNIVIIINDLHRHFLSYYGIKCLSKLLNLSPLACHDGPLSVLRAFRYQELLNIMLQSGANQFQIKWCWPFRWRVIIGVADEN